MCDTMSIITTLPSGGRDVEVIFTLGFWTEQIVVHWSNDPTGRWSDPNMVSGIFCIFTYLNSSSGWGWGGLCDSNI